MVHTSGCTFPKDLLGEGWKAHLPLSGSGHSGWPAWRQGAVVVGLRERLLFQAEAAEDSGFDFRWYKVESLERQGWSAGGLSFSKRVLEKRTAFLFSF